MLLKDLRPVIGEQVVTNVTVASGDNSVVSGKLWLFSVDDTLDHLEVKELRPEDNVLELTLVCSPQELRDNDWNSAFNQEVILSINDGSTDELMKE